MNIVDARTSFLRRQVELEGKQKYCWRKSRGGTRLKCVDHLRMVTQISDMELPLGSALLGAGLANWALREGIVTTAGTAEHGDKRL